MAYSFYFQSISPTVNCLYDEGLQAIVLRTAENTVTPGNRVLSPVRYSLTNHKYFKISLFLVFFTRR